MSFRKILEIWGQMFSFLINNSIYFFSLQAELLKTKAKKILKEGSAPTKFAFAKITKKRECSEKRNEITVKRQVGTAFYKALLFLYNLAN